PGNAPINGKPSTGTGRFPTCSAAIWPVDRFVYNGFMAQPSRKCRSLTFANDCGLFDSQLVAPTYRESSRGTACSPQEKDLFGVLITQPGCRVFELRM